MIRFKIKDDLYKVIDGYRVSESSREVKFSNIKIDFTGKTISNLPYKYQECQLADVDIIDQEAIEGQTIEGTSFQIEADTSKSSELMYVKGNTIQEGTPTPSSPVNVNVVTGKQDIVVCEKNLFNPTRDTATENGITFTKNSDGTYTANGTATGFVSFTVGTIKFPTNTEITYSGSPENGSMQTYSFNLQKVNGSVWLNDEFGNGITTTLEANEDYYVRLIIRSGVSVNNLTYKPMIRLSSVSDNTYEEYKGNTYEINLGKNLCNIVKDDVTHAGIRFVKQQDGTIIANGTASEFTGHYEFARFSFPVDTQITYSGAPIDSSISTYSLNLKKIVGSTETWLTDELGSGRTVVCEAGAVYSVRLVIREGVTVNDIVYKPMIELGDVKSEYAPYFEPIELCKIGDYQDRIYKDNGKWYLEKKIGKYIFTGNEAISLQNNGKRIYIPAISNSIPEPLHTPNTSTKYGMYSDKLVEVTAGNTWNGIQGISYDYNTGVNTGNFDISINGISTLADYRTAIVGIIVYYILETPTITKITDTELISQLESIELLNGTNNVSVVSPYLSGIIGVHYNYQEEKHEINIKKTIFTGYINNYTLPSMKNKLEYRELDIDLLSPLAMATLRTVDAVGTYNLQPLIREIVQPLIDDGFVLKELNVGNNQITVNYLTETVESALNKLSNKHDFWWYIDENKNIYINSISSLLARKPVITYNNNNKIEGLINFTPSIDATDYCNTVDFTNVRLFTNSNFLRYDWIDYTENVETIQYEFYNPLIKRDFIKSGDEIEFDIPFVINTEKRGTTQGGTTHTTDDYFYLTKIDSNRTYQLVLQISSDKNGDAIIPDNVSIEDSYSDSNEFVFVRDNFFSNLIIGMKYNGTSDIEIGSMYSATALMWTKIKINDNIEIEKNKNIISKTGIVEKQINMNEQWKTFEELIEIANSYIKSNDTNVERVMLEMDISHDIKVGDIIDIDRESFLTKGKYIVTDKVRTYYDNVTSWTYYLNNTNVLENYVDLFRSSDKEEETTKIFNLVTSDYVEEGIKEYYGVDVM